MPANETSNAVASEIEQPTDGAVDEGIQAETDSSNEAPPGEATPTDEEQQELLAGKYTSVEELVKGYQNATAEASRLAAEKSAYERGVQSATRQQPAAETKPQFTPDQLKQYKAGYLTSLSDTQAKRHMALKDGDFETAARLEEQANKAASQIVMIDEELGRQDRATSARQARQETVSRTLDTDAKRVLSTYQSQLQPGSDFYNKSEEIWQHLRDTGLPDNASTTAMAVAMAAELTGVKASAAPETRKNLTQSIQTALKQGAVAGAGKAKRSAAPQDFMQMTDKEFIDYKKSRGME